MMLRLLCFVIGLALAGSGCGGGPVQGECSDGLDNDGDGFFDGEDPGCQNHGGDTELDRLDCIDGIDNDGDALIDGDDWGCQVPGSMTEVEPVRECNDGLDNDGDMLADYPQDPGCESPIDETETNPPACLDGADNDGDGKADYPRDPGCESELDDDETTPSPVPHCGDGLDNDGDGITDYPDEPGCTAAADSSEIDDCGSLPVAGHFGGTLSGATADGTGSLAAPTGCELDGSSAIASEVVYGFLLDRPLSKLIVHTEGSAIDTVLYLRQDDCSISGPLSMCDDNSLGGTSRVELIDPEEGTYYIVVDGKSSFGGAFKVTVQGEIPSQGPCDPTDPNFVCASGSCSGNTCD